jgi:DNA/RNA-binding domain of Phe-tRNA-synthetase-like protein
VELTLSHRLPRGDLAVGAILVDGIVAGPAPERLARELSRWVQARGATPLTQEEEALRRGSRDILRNGSYKPTGRGKPASEYLLRAAREGSFPRVSGPVDANNLVSLRHCVAVSVWDVDRAGAGEFELRLGHRGEAYVFNPAGQSLSLRDLACGCAVNGGESTPHVSPVKDSMSTKIADDTGRVAGWIYYPLGAGSAEHLAEITEELLGWCLACGPSARGAYDVMEHGARITLRV